MQQEIFPFEMYLSDRLFHLAVSEGGDGGFKVVHNTFKAVTLQYLSLVTAQQTQGHLKNHIRALDKQEVCHTAHIHAQGSKAMHWQQYLTYVRNTYIITRKIISPLFSNSSEPHHIHSFRSEQFS